MAAVPNLDLKLLQVFLAVFDSRSVGQAAIALRMSQPGLSTALTRLRRTFGDGLFVRTTGGMKPTARAVALREPIRAIVESIESRLLARPEFDPATSTRQFRISLSDIGEGIYLPLILQAIANVAPGVTLRSVSLPPKQLHEAMEAGAVDLAAGYFPDIKTSEFLHRRVGLHSFACIVSRGHPLTSMPMTFKRFTDAKHVVIEASGRSQEVLEKYLKSKRIHRRVVLYTPHFMSVPVVVASTDLVAIVPQALADFTSGQPELKQVPLPFMPPTFQVNIHWHRAGHDDPGNRWLRELVFSKIHILQARRYDRNGRPTQKAAATLRS
jgi:DNA-binding transcriptional LysR family regulator